MLLVPHPTPPSYAHLWHVYGYLNGSHVLKLFEHCIWHHHKVTNGDPHIKFTVTSRVWGLLFGCIEEAWGSERHWVAGLGSDLRSLIYMLTVCMHYALWIDWDPRMSAPIYKVCNLCALYTLTWFGFLIYFIEVIILFIPRKLHNVHHDAGQKDKGKFRDVKKGKEPSQPGIYLDLLSVCLFSVVSLTTSRRI